MNQLGTRGVGIAAAIALLAGASAPAVLAQTPAPAAPAAQPAYNPSMADLMTTSIQPRHTKLGLAGKARDWTYLNYEISELRNAFNRIARTIPVFDRTTDTAAEFNSRIKEPLEMVDAAIKAKNPTRFDGAYANLTDSCNACHKALKKDWIVIKAPDATMFGDQDFTGRSR